MKNAIDCLASTLGVATRGMTTKRHARPNAMIQFHCVALRPTWFQPCDLLRTCDVLTDVSQVVSAVPQGRTALLQNVQWSDLLAARQERLSARRIQVVFQRKWLSAVIGWTQTPQTKVNSIARFPSREALRLHEQKALYPELKQWLTEVLKENVEQLSMRELLSLEDNLKSTGRQSSSSCSTEEDHFMEHSATYRVELLAQANFSAQTFKPAHKARAGQRAALSVQSAAAAMQHFELNNGPQASSSHSELSAKRAAKNVIDFCWADQNRSSKSLASYFQSKKCKSKVVRRS